MAIANGPKGIGNVSQAKRISPWDRSKRAWGASSGRRVPYWARRLRFFLQAEFYQMTDTALETFRPFEVTKQRNVASCAVKKVKFLQSKGLN